MKYFKHFTTDRNSIESKLIRSRFGAAGYGIYQSLLEVIAEEIEKNNQQDWGYANKMHTIETLSDECSTDPETLKKVLQLCDEKGIFEKKDGRLYSSLILKRLDEYTNKLRRDSVVTTEQVRPNRIEENRIEENKKEKNRRENPLHKNGKALREYGSPEINSLISYLKEKLHLPVLDETDKTNRQYCYLLIKKFGDADRIKLLINATSQHEFWSTHITSFKALYYKAVTIISSTRDQKLSVLKL